ncbi:MAG: right-handed parallel beta-helix repeat-containing protein [Candidatus Bathyarchaeota archaeon]
MFYNTKKMAAIIALMLVLSLVLVFLLELGTVKEESTIYIRADGNVEGTDKIQRDVTVYTFTDNITRNNSDDSDICIVIERSNVIINGNGYTLQGSGLGTGFYWATDINNVTIQNITINELSRGIQLVSSSNNTITGNKLINLRFSGIEIKNSSDNNNIFGNQIETSTSAAIDLFATYRNIITGNNITDNNCGIGFWGSPNNLIYHNNFINNTRQVNDVYFAPNIALTFESPSINIWDNGVEGNYWSNYTGQDNDGDGIGDTPHIIHENNQDNYPLMNPVDISTIPEFPSWIILPLLITTTVAIIICRKGLSNHFRESY